MWAADTEPTIQPKGTSKDGKERRLGGIHGEQRAEVKILCRSNTSIKWRQ